MVFSRRTGSLPGPRSQSAGSGCCPEAEGGPLAICPGEVGTVALGTADHSLPGQQHLPA